MAATMYWTGSASGLWTNVSNWVESDGTAPAAVPGTGDSVVFDGRVVAALTGSPASTIRLTKVQIKQTCPTSYYIGTALSPIAAAVDTFVVGEDDGLASSSAGCQKICWNFGATASGYSGSTVKILRTNTTGLDGLEVVQLQGTHSSNKIYLEGPCLVGLGTSFPGQAYTMSQVNVTGSGARCNLGSGGTLTTIYQSDGSVILNCALTTLTQISGVLRTEGTGAITTVNAGGIFISNSSGTITTLSVTDTGFGDFSKTSVARTVTTANVYGRGKLNANNGQALSVTFTNKPGALQGAVTSQIEFGTGLYIQQSATP